MTGLTIHITLLNTDDMDLGSILSNLSKKGKASEQQVGQLFFFWWLDCLFALLGSASVKAASKHVNENDPRGLKLI